LGTQELQTSKSLSHDPSFYQQPTEDPPASSFLDWLLLMMLLRIKTPSNKGARHHIGYVVMIIGLFA
jgi:hypothetical protein